MIQRIFSRRNTSWKIKSCHQKLQRLNLAKNVLQHSKRLSEDSSSYTKLRFMKSEKSRELKSSFNESGSCLGYIMKRHRSDLANMQLSLAKEKLEMWPYE